MNPTQPVPNLFGSNPFDPFGLQNPFGMPTQPLQEKRKSQAVKGDALINSANEAFLEDGGNKKPEVVQQPANKTSKLNKLFEESDDDDDKRMSKQKLLSEKYKEEPKQEIQVPPQRSTSKLFNDDDEDGFIPSLKSIQTLHYVPSDIIEYQYILWIFHRVIKLIKSLIIIRAPLVNEEIFIYVLAGFSFIGKKTKYLLTKN